MHFEARPPISVTPGATEKLFHGSSCTDGRGLDPGNDTPSTDDREPIAIFNGVKNIWQSPRHLSGGLDRFVSRSPGG